MSRAGCERCFNYRYCHFHLTCSCATSAYADPCEEYLQLTDLSHGRPDLCDHCGGSGILNVESIPFHEFGLYEEDVWTKEVSSCHACENGKLWEEILDG